MNIKRICQPLAPIRPKKFNKEPSITKQNTPQIKGDQFLVYGQDYMSSLYKQAIQQNYSTSLRHLINERSQIVDFLILFIYKGKQRKRTYFQAVYIMDAYLKARVHEFFSIDTLLQIALVSFFLASKLQEQVCIGVENLITADETLTSEKIFFLEKQILSTLNFDILIPTSYDFLNCFLQTASVLNVPKNVMRIAKAFCCLALMHSDYCNIYPHYLAAMCLVLALKSQGLDYNHVLFCISIRWDEISSNLKKFEQLVIQTEGNPRFTEYFQVSLSNNSDLIYVLSPKQEEQRKNRL